MAQNFNPTWVSVAPNYSYEQKKISWSTPTKSTVVWDEVNTFKEIWVSGKNCVF